MHGTHWVLAINLPWDRDTKRKHLSVGERSWRLQLLSQQPGQQSLNFKLLFQHFIQWRFTPLKSINALAGCSSPSSHPSFVLLCNEAESTSDAAENDLTEVPSSSCRISRIKHSPFRMFHLSCSPRGFPEAFTARGAVNHAESSSRACCKPAQWQIPGRELVSMSWYTNSEVSIWCSIICCHKHRLCQRAGGTESEWGFSHGMKQLWQPLHTSDRGSPFSPAALMPPAVLLIHPETTLTSTSAYLTNHSLGIKCTGRFLWRCMAVEHTQIKRKHLERPALACWWVPQRAH